MILTLGFYEIYWLYQTRKELIALTGAYIPNIKRLIAIKALAIILFGIFLFGFHLAVTPRPYAAKPSAECFGQYDISAECRATLDKYYAPDHQLDGVMLMFAMLVALFGAGWLNIKWMIPYFRAVQQLTGEDLLSNNIMAAIYLRYNLLGMLALQSRFNQIPKLNENLILPN